MADQNVDYKVSGADSGEKTSSAIQPVNNGEAMDQTVLQRPSENLRKRTELIRDILEEQKYLNDYDRSLLITGGGQVTWGGAAPTIGNTGAFTITADLAIRPFLAPKTSTRAQYIILESQPTKSVIVRTIDPTGVTQPPRAYSGANKISLVVTAVTLGTGAVTVTVDGTPADNFHIVIDNDPTSGTTTQQLVNALNASSAFTAAGLEAVLGPSALTGAKVADAADGLTYLLSGAADAEAHIVTASQLSSFFSLSANKLEEGDVLAIWYDVLVHPTTDGGRRQSIDHAPENTAALSGNNLFVVRNYPERLPLAIPVARVVDGDLILLNGTRFKKDLPTDVYGSFVKKSGDTMSGQLSITAQNADAGLDSTGGATNGVGVYGHGGGTTGTGVRGDGGSNGGAGVSGFGTGAAVGVYGSGAAGYGVRGDSTNSSGVIGNGGANGDGVVGNAGPNGVGVRGLGNSHAGVRGEGSGTGTGNAAVVGVGSGNFTIGVSGTGGDPGGVGVEGFGGGGVGEANGAVGIYGEGGIANPTGGVGGTGVYGQGGTGNGEYGIGVYGEGNPGVKGVGVGTSAEGVRGEASGANSEGIRALASGTGSTGVYATGATGVEGHGTDGTNVGPGVAGYGGTNQPGVVGTGNGTGSGVYGTSTDGYGGQFEASGNLSPLHLSARSADPAAGAIGDFYVNNVDNKPKFHDGTSFKTVALVESLLTQNIVLNSSLLFWQRGTTRTITDANRYYTADRWSVKEPGASQNLVVSKVTGTSPFDYAHRTQRTAGNTATGTIFIVQEIDREFVKMARGKKLRIKGQFKTGATFSGSVTAKIVTSLDVDTTDYANYATSVDTPVTQALSSTAGNWSSFNATTSAVVAGSTCMAVVFTWVPSGTAGATDFFDFTGISVTIGDEDLPWRLGGVTVAGELLACQRYYEKSYELDTAPGSVTGLGLHVTLNTGDSTANGTNWTLGVHPRFRVPKRVAPTVALYGGNGTANAWFFNGTYQASSAFTSTMGFTAANNTGGTVVPTAGSVTGHWTAEAEI